MMQPRRRGPWGEEEDAALKRLVDKFGCGDWVLVAESLGTRSAKQCRERYHQNLKPGLNHDPMSPDEAQKIEELVGVMGKRWAEIARRLPGRSDNAVKNWWNGAQNRRRRMEGKRREEEEKRRVEGEKRASRSPSADGPASGPTPHRQHKAQLALPRASPSREIPSLPASHNYPAPRAHGIAHAPHLYAHGARCCAEYLESVSGSLPSPTPTTSPLSEYMENAPQHATDEVCYTTSPTSGADWAYQSGFILPPINNVGSVLLPRAASALPALRTRGGSRIMPSTCPASNSPGGPVARLPPIAALDDTHTPRSLLPTAPSSPLGGSPPNSRGPDGFLPVNKDARMDVSSLLSG